MSALDKAIAAVGKFDLSNPQHLAMRKILADVYVDHVIALDLGVPANVNSSREQAVGIHRTAIWCMDIDIKLWKVSAAVVEHMWALERCHKARAAA